jgi:Na+-driven multidrug efflux pump
MSALALIPLSIAHSVFGVLSARGNTMASLKASIIYSAAVVVPALALSRRPEFSAGWLWAIMLAASCLEAVIALKFLRDEFTKPAANAVVEPIAEAA